MGDLGRTNGARWRPGGWARIMGAKPSRTVTREVIVGATMVGVFWLFAPMVLHALDRLWPPEVTIEPRAASVPAAAPGESFRAAGRYQIMRRCAAQFASIREWTTQHGVAQARVETHFGSVDLTPGPPVEIARQHTIPDDALPGTEYRYRTIGEWRCYPWAGSLVPPYRQTYREIAVRVVSGP